MQDTFLARATRTISRVFVKKKKDSKASFDPLDSEVPPIVEACCVFLETYALNTEGLFRLSGQFNVIESVKKQFEKGKLTSFPPDTDHHLIAGLLKCWLCALEMPLLTYELAETFIQSIEAPEAEERIRRLCAVISMLPECNRRVFQRLIGLFSLVHGHRDQNKMGAKNLAIVFAPTLLRYSVPDLSVMLKMSDAANTVMETCILNYGPLFVDTDAYMASSRGSSVRFEAGVQVLHYVKMPETLEQGLTDEELERRKKREEAAQSVAQESAAILAQEEKKKPKLDEELVQHAKTVLSDMATRARLPTELELRREQEEAEKRATVELETLARKQLELEKEEQKQREELQALEREQEQLKEAQASSLEMQLRQLQGDIEELETSLRALRKESLGDQDSELAAAEEFLTELREEEAQIKKLIEEEQQLKSIEEEERLLLKQLSGETDVDAGAEETGAGEAPCIAVQASSEDGKSDESDEGSSERPVETAPANDASADVLLKALEREEAELQEIMQEQSRLSVVVRERVASIGNAEEQARLEEELRLIEEEAARLEEENASHMTDKETDESAHVNTPASSGGTGDSLPSAGGAVEHESSAAAKERGAEAGGDAAGEGELPEKDTGVRDVAENGKEEDMRCEKLVDEELIDEDVVDEELAAQEELLRQLEEEARLLEESGVELELNDETGGELNDETGGEAAHPPAQEPTAPTVELHDHQPEQCNEAKEAAAPSAATTQTAPATGGAAVAEPGTGDLVGKAPDACSALLTAKRRKEQREQEKAELLERERKEQALARERQAIADRMEQQRREREELAAKEEERRQQMERERMEAEEEIRRRAEELRLKKEQQEAARQREEERERREMDLRRQQQEQRRQQEQEELARKKKERERRDEELREERQARQGQQQSGLDVENQLADLLDFVGKTDGPRPSSQASQAEEDAEEDDGTGEVAVIEYTDGARYEGGVNGNQWEGRGRCFFADGTFYEGEVHEDHMHGTGTLVYANGHKYVGQFERDERHGFGRYTSSNGDVYEGEFVRDKRCGKGVYRMANGAVYEGEFKNGMPNGTGKYVFETGDVYEGEFKDDEFHGRGTYRSAGGAVYCGDFVDGLKEGKGKYTLKNGDVYEGEFKSGKFNGHGVYTFSGGRGTMEGEFRKGKPVK